MFWKYFFFKCKMLSMLTHKGLGAFLRDIGKQCKIKSDAAKDGVSSGSTLFAYRSFFFLKYE